MQCDRKPFLQTGNLYQTEVYRYLDLLRLFFINVINGNQGHGLTIIAEEHF